VKKSTLKDTLTSGLVGTGLIILGLCLIAFGLFWLWLTIKGVIDEGIRDSYSLTYSLLFGVFLIAIGAYMVYLPFENTIKKLMGKRAGSAPPPPPPPPPSPSRQRRTSSRFL